MWRTSGFAGQCQASWQYGLRDRQVWMAHGSVWPSASRYFLPAKSEWKDNMSRNMCAIITEMEQSITDVILRTDKPRSPKRERQFSECFRTKNNFMHQILSLYREFWYLYSSYTKNALLIKIDKILKFTLKVNLTCSYMIRSTTIIREPS